MSRVRVPASSINGSVFLFGAVALLLIFAKVLLIPLAFALTLSFLLVPVVAALEKRHVSRPIAVAIVSMFMCIVLFEGGYILSRQVLNIAQTLPGYRENIQKKITALHSSSESSLEAAALMLEDMSGKLVSKPVAHGDAMPVQVVEPASDQFRSTIELIGTILDPIGRVGIVLIFTIYMLIHREDLRHRLLLVAGMGNINLMTRALEDATNRISQYLVMQFQVNACYGILFGAGLYGLHVPNATLWGVIAGTLRIVPFVGTLMGMVLPLVLAIAVSSSWWTPALVIALFLVLEMTVANLIEPWLFSERTGISSLALLASAIFWSMLWGWPGLVLSTPLTVCLVVVGRHVPQLAFLHSLLGTNAQLSPAAHMYERLLAMDQEQAFVIAEQYLEGKPLEKLYDSVIIPVLGLAEEDRHRGALDKVRTNFVLLSIGELVARLTNYRQENAVDDKTERTIRINALTAPLRKEFAVVCLSASDKADELTTIMLTQLLEREGHQTLNLLAEAISDDILAAMAAEKDTVVFISALPPFAFAQARSVCHRVRTQMPENRIVVAMWNSDEDTDDLQERFGNAPPNVVIKTLAQAMHQVETWQHSTRRA